MTHGSHGEKEERKQSNISDWKLHQNTHKMQKINQAGLKLEHFPIYLIFDFVTISYSICVQALCLKIHLDTFPLSLRSPIYEFFYEECHSYISVNGTEHTKNLTCFLGKRQLSEMLLYAKLADLVLSRLRCTQTTF